MLIDFSLTFAILHLSHDFYEANKLANFFFSLGSYGYLIAFTFQTLLLFCFSRFVVFMVKYQDNRDILHTKKPKGYVLSWFALLTTAVSQILVIANSVIYILKY